MKLLEKAGCFAIVLEKVPADLGEKVAKSLKVPVIGIGAGGQVDGQVLVTHDLLGMTHEFNPRFLRRYLSLYEQITDAIKSYVKDVKRLIFRTKRTILMIVVLYEDNHIIAVNKKSGESGSGRQNR